MLETNRPYRSALYIPASKERALEKARGLACDAILFDFEDAVAPDAKPGARDILAAALASSYGHRAKILRVNGAKTPWGADDLAFAATQPIDGVLLPKVNGVADIDTAAAQCDAPIWVMIETPQAIFNIEPIAAHPKVAGFVMGTNDLAKDMGLRFRADRAHLAAALSLSVLAAKAHGRVVLDGVFNDFSDDAALAAECEQGRDFGFDGKTLIHPNQLAIANRAFAPSEAEIDLANRQIAGFDAAMARGEAVAVVDGKIVENLHIETARATLDKARMIKGLEI